MYQEKLLKAIHFSHENIYRCEGFALGEWFNELLKALFKDYLPLSPLEYE